MDTSRISICVVGTLAPKRMVIPSSGWMRMTSAFTPRAAVSLALKGRCGAGLNCSATSVTRRGTRFAVRR
ncbi:Uncharacterised protein [Mycobacteroides abscessus subsp. abscessus]|nr:Uncharacterised protein [Mycobacteroides abscessus subsp. abscessus]